MDNTYIDRKERSQRGKGGEKLQDLNCMSVLPSQCLLCYIIGPVPQLAFSPLILLKLNVYWERQLWACRTCVRVTICLWLEALTHLNTLKSAYLIPPLGALSVMWGHESAHQVRAQTSNNLKAKSLVVRMREVRLKGSCAEGLKCLVSIVQTKSPWWKYSTAFCRTRLGLVALHSNTRRLLTSVCSTWSQETVSLA